MTGSVLTGIRTLHLMEPFLPVSIADSIRTLLFLFLQDSIIIKGTRLKHFLYLTLLLIESPITKIKLLRLLAFQ